MRIYTLTEALAETGLAREEALERLRAGSVPGAERVRGGAWRIPVAALPYLDPARTDVGPAPSVEGAGPGRLAEANLDAADPRAAGQQPRIRELVDTARRAEAELSTSRTRSALAAADAVWALVEVAARHEPDRDGVCRHDGWSWPCPDRADVTEALEVATRWILEGGAR